jgi:hypothetical protein
MQDALGQRGEALFTILMTAFEPGEQPLFRPQFLGDKWPYIDFFVELLGHDDIKPFFFVQVKTTRQGYTKRQHRLKIGVAEDKILGLVAYPAPTYLVGIDEWQERGYILSVNGEMLSSLSSMSTQFPIDIANRENLWQEVSSFWKGYDRTQLSSGFVDSDWR